MGARELKLKNWREELRYWLDTTGLELGYRLPRVQPVTISVYALGVTRIQRRRLSFFPV